MDTGTPALTELREQAVADLVERRELAPEVEAIFREFILGICPIPRKSENEQFMAEHIIEVASAHGFVVEQPDEKGNLLVRVGATQGYDHLPGIVFQGHMDMVCDAGKNALTNPETEGVVPAIDSTGRWLTSIDSTLGADNGIAIATMLTLMKTDVPHGEMAFLFTTQEETSMDGAKALSFDLSQYQYLVNLDWERENEAALSSACGGDTILTFPIEKELLDPNLRVVQIDLDGLLGGHSGLDIGEKRENAIKLMATVLKTAQDELGAKLITVEGGTAKNAIPPRSRAIIAYDPTNEEAFEQFMDQWQLFFRRNMHYEPGITIKSQAVTEQTYSEALTQGSSDTLLDLLMDIPHGVRDMSEAYENVIDTSTNLALVKQTGNEIKITSMSRSISETHREQIRQVIAKIGERYKAGVEQTNEYKGWLADEGTELIHTLEEAYLALGVELKKTGTHAGLECGTISLLYPHLQTASIGPTIENPHKTTERVLIESVSNLYMMLDQFLKIIANRGQAQT